VARCTAGLGETLPPSIRRDVTLAGVSLEAIGRSGVTRFGGQPPLRLPVPLVLPVIEIGVLLRVLARGRVIAAPADVPVFGCTAGAVWV
jgi:hypothetical protein